MGYGTWDRKTLLPLLGVTKEKQLEILSQSWTCGNMATCTISVMWATKTCFLKLSPYSYFLLERKTMTNLDSVLKIKDITLLTKVCIVKAMVFPVVMYECESWTIKKAEHRRIDAFELWCWRRLLRVPWMARRSNQSILREINPEYSLEGLMLKLELQYFGHRMWRNWLIGKDPDAGKDWRQEEKGTTEDEMVKWHHSINGHESELTLGDNGGQRNLACYSPWGRKESDTT